MIFQMNYKIYLEYLRASIHCVSGLQQQSRTTSEEQDDKLMIFSNELETIFRIFKSFYPLYVATSAAKLDKLRGTS